MDDDHQGCSYVQDVLVEDLDKADHTMIDTADMVLEDLNKAKNVMKDTVDMAGKLHGERCPVF